MNEFIDGKTTIKAGEFWDNIIREIKHHKTWCNDIKCHVYTVITRAVSGSLRKEVDLINKETGERTG